MDQYSLPVEFAGQNRNAGRLVAVDYHYFAPHRYWMEETVARVQVEAEQRRRLSRSRPLADVVRRIMSAGRSIVTILLAYARDGSPVTRRALVE